MIGLVVHVADEEVNNKEWFSFQYWVNNIVSLSSGYGSLFLMRKCFNEEFLRCRAYIIKYHFCWVISLNQYWMGKRNMINTIVCTFKFFWWRLISKLVEFSEQIHLSFCWCLAWHWIFVVKFSFHMSFANIFSCLQIAWLLFCSISRWSLRIMTTLGVLDMLSIVFRYILAFAP